MLKKITSFLSILLIPTLTLSVSSCESYPNTWKQPVSEVDTLLKRVDVIAHSLETLKPELPYKTAKTLELLRLIANQFKPFMELKPIYFAKSSFELDESGLTQCVIIFDKIKNLPTVTKFYVVGRATTEMTSIENGRLGRKRADSVVRFFTDKGMNKKRFLSMSVGDTLNQILEKDFISEDLNQSVEVAILH